MSPIAILAIGIGSALLVIGFVLGARALRGVRRRRLAARRAAAARATPLEAISADELAYRIGVEGAPAPELPRRMVVVGDRAAGDLEEADIAAAATVALTAAPVAHDDEPLLGAAPVPEAAMISSAPPVIATPLAPRPVPLPTTVPFSAGKTRRRPALVAALAGAAVFAVVAVAFGASMFGVTGGSGAPDPRAVAVVVATASPTPSPSPTPTPTPSATS